MTSSFPSITHEGMVSAVNIRRVALLSHSKWFIYLHNNSIRTS